MTNSISLYVKIIPSPMREYFKRQTQNEDVDLTLRDALQCAVEANLTQSELEDWIEHWVELYTSEEKDSSFEDGQHSKDLY